MRQITSEAIYNFNNNFTFQKSNTRVTVGTGTHRLLPEYKGALTVLSLHGKDIAIKTKDGLYITNAGWQSNVTKERLNGLDGVCIYQKDWDWYLNDQPWDGSLTKIY